jgi:hypothetical protein
MKSLLLILTILLTSTICYCQDSVRAKVIKTTDTALVFRINGWNFISYDCRCPLKKGDVFWIAKQKFDSLLKEAKIIRRQDL